MKVHFLKRQYLPVFPKNPVAWHSSTIVMAPYFWANLIILGRGATLPSIEKTPSVTITFSLLSFIDFNFSSKSVDKNEVRFKTIKIKIIETFQSVKVLFSDSM